MPRSKQWVNLPKDDKFKGDGIDSKADLGPVKISIKFKNGNLAGFRVRLDADGGGNIVYSAAERGRNGNFRTVVAGSATNMGTPKCRLTKTIALPVGGGNKYKLTATYRKKEVVSGIKVEVRKRLFYQIMHMKGETSHATATLDSAFLDTARKFFLELKKKGADAEVPLIHNIDDADATHNAFIRGCGAAYELKDLHPYSFAVCFVRYIADFATESVSHELDIDAPSVLAKFNWDAGSVTIETRSYLAFELEEVDDWLQSATCTFTPDGTTDTRDIDPANYTVEVDTSSKAFTYGGRHKIKVTFKSGAVRRALIGRTKGKLNIALDVKIVDGWTNGFAYNGINLIAIANRVVWQDMTASCRQYTLNHEVGHKIGMTGDGTGTSPDSHPDYYHQNLPAYAGTGHSGPHCKKGATYTLATTDWAGTPGCVMFGADSAYDAGGAVHASPPEFCDKCEPMVRKIDVCGATNLTNGFQISLDDY